jgi:hypothetical protein
MHLEAREPECLQAFHRFILDQKLHERLTGLKTIMNNPYVRAKEKDPLAGIEGMLKVMGGLKDLEIEIDPIPNSSQSAATSLKIVENLKHL